MSDHDRHIVPIPKGMVTSVGRQLAVTEKLLANQLSPPLLVPQFWHPGAVTSLAFSPGRKTIAVGGQDHTVRLLDVERGVCLRVLEGHSAEIKAVSFSPSGRMIASLGWDHTICLWEVEGGKLLKEFKWSAGVIKAITFTSDDQIIALVKEGETISFWDVERAICLHLIDQFPKDISCAAFSPSGRVVLTVFKDAFSVLWETESGKPLRRVEGLWCNESTTAPALSNDGKMIASGRADGTIRLWDTTSGECLRVMTVTPECFINSIAFSFDGRMVAAGGAGNISLWDVETGTLQLASGYSAEIHSVGFSPNNQLIALESCNKKVCIRETVNGRASRVLDYDLPQIFDAVFSLGGEMVAKGMADGTIRIWETSCGSCIRVLAGHSGGVRCVAFFPDGMALASAGEDGTVRLWDIDSGKCKRVLNAQSGGIWSVSFSPDGQTLVSVGEDDTIRFCTADSGESQRVIDDPNLKQLSFVAFSPDAQTVVSVAEECIIYLWNTVNGELIKMVDLGEISIDSVDFFPDGRAIIVVGDGDHVLALDTESGEILWEKMGYSWLQKAVALSRDGRLIALGYGDGKIQLLEASTGDSLADIFFFLDDSWAVIAPDGRYDSSDFGESTWLRWTVSMKSYPITKFKERYYTPGLLAQVSANG